jgi:hypothetical protein
MADQSLIAAAFAYLGLGGLLLSRQQQSPLGSSSIQRGVIEPGAKR